MPRKRDEKPRTLRYTNAERQLFAAAGWQIFHNDMVDEAYIHDPRGNKVGHASAYIYDPRSLDWRMLTLPKPGEEVTEENLKFDEEDVLREEGHCETVEQVIEQVKAAFAMLDPHDWQAL